MHVNELVVDPSMVLVLVLLLLLGWNEKGAAVFNFRLYLNIGCHFVFGINKVKRVICTQKTSHKHNNKDMTLLR